MKEAAQRSKDQVAIAFGRTIWESSRRSIHKDAMQSNHRIKCACVIVTVSIMVSLSTAYAYIGYLCFRYGPETNIYTFTAFPSGFNRDDKVAQAWKSRLLSTYLSSVAIPSDSDLPSQSKRVAMWYGAWFFLCCLVYMFYDKKNQLFLMFGTFCALCYGFIPSGAHLICPWDMPALFFYALIYILATCQKPQLVAPIIIVGTGFKETIMLCALLFLYWPTFSLRKRVLWTVTCLSGCILVKLIIDLATDNAVLLTQCFYSVDGEFLLWYNLKFMTRLVIFHPVFVNSGTLISLLILALVDKDSRDIAGWKIIIPLFVIGIFLMGRINEYRIFYEMIPISLVVIANRWERINSTLTDAERKA